MIDINRQRELFPIRNFADVDRLFEYNLDTNNGHPNLTLLSIVVGVIEHSLVSVSDKDDLLRNSVRISHGKASKKIPSLIAQSQFLSSISSDDFGKDNGQSSRSVESISSSSDLSNCSSPDLTASANLDIPEIEFEVVETLYKKFFDRIKNSIDLKDDQLQKTNLKIKKIADSVWEHLSNNYNKDKAHLQSIFSYLTTNKLDCFGCAFAVVAGAQVLGVKDIYLALSEDHAWVMFELPPDENKTLKEMDNNVPVPSCVQYGTCEVTWHGKTNGAKRGEPVTDKNSWLYTNGYAVKCDYKMCMAALVNSINPSISANTDSEVLSLLQQRLLWLLYKQGAYFPMSLGTLGELENICPTPNAPLTPHELFNLGIEISRTEYNDSHVYPYSYLASYLLNHGRFKEALETWADSSSVMTKYNYDSRYDEEVYKEFLEIANELFPSIVKSFSNGGVEPGGFATKPFLQDPECLALILKFYDNVCCWEEGSPTPVLHIKWASNFSTTVTKFSPEIRSKVKLTPEDEWSQSKASASESETPSRGDSTSSTPVDPNLKIGNDNSNTASLDSNMTTSRSISRAIRGKRFETDSENKVIVISRSRKIAGLRDLLQAKSINKIAIELQLTAQSQTAARGRSNSSSISSDFIPSLGGSTRSKRLRR